MASFQDAYLCEMLRQQAQAQSSTMWEAINNAQARPSPRPGDTFDLCTMRPTEPHKPSRFAGIEVVDLEPGADGVWSVPAEMLPFVRAL